MTTFNLRHLLTAIEVQRLGSLSAAAEVVHVSQSAASQAVAGLERTLDVPLFTRTNKGLFTSEAGELFLSRARRALDYLKDINGKPIHRALTAAQLNAVKSLVEAGAYSRAASRLGIAQPTVHRTVRQVEDHLGQPLFKSSPQGVQSTVLARRFARQVGLYLAELEQARSELEEHQGIMHGTINVGSLPMARTRLIPKAVTQLLSEYPDVSIRIVDGPYEEQLHGLQHGSIDLIVGALRDPTSDLEQEPLFTNHLSIVFRSGHPLAEDIHRQAARLAELEWVVPRINTPAREAFSRFFQSRNLDVPKRIIECSSLVATRGLLLESDRVALLPARQVEIERRAGLLDTSKTPLAETDRVIGISTRKQWLPTGVQRRFLEILREQSGG